MREIRTGYEDGVRRNRRKALLGDMFDLLLTFVDVIIGAIARLVR